MDSPAFQFVPVASQPATKHHQEQSGWFYSGSIIHLYTLARSFLSLAQAEQSQLSASPRTTGAPLPSHPHGLLLDLPHHVRVSLVARKPRTGPSTPDVGPHPSRKGHLSVPARNTHPNATWETAGPHCWLAPGQLVTHHDAQRFSKACPTSSFPLQQRSCPAPGITRVVEVSSATHPHFALLRRSVLARGPAQLRADSAAGRGSRRLAARNKSSKFPGLPKKYFHSKCFTIEAFIRAPKKLEVVVD